MTDHTPEPWFSKAQGDPMILAAADYERAAACVNACAGIRTEMLQGGGVADLVLVLQGILEEPDNDLTLDSLEAARDALAPFRKDLTYD